MKPTPDLLHAQLQSGAVVDCQAAAALRQRLAPHVAHFGDSLAEYQAAQNSCALFDLSDRVQILLAGRDAAAFLHKFCTNNLQRLSAGQGCEAMVTNIKGHILAHIFAFVTTDGVWIDSPPSDQQLLLDHLDRYIFSEDVQLHGCSQSRGELLVAGPQAAVQLAPLGIEAGNLGLHEHVAGHVGEVSVHMRRVDIWDQPGYLIAADRSQLVELWQALAAAGIRPAGACAFHALRIQAAFPLFGIDITQDNLAQEAGRTQQAISFTKGCYLGQEPIARIDALGHINKIVACLQVETTDPLPASAEVQSVEGSRIGHITSAVPLPGTDHSLAMATIRTGHATPGTPLQVAHASGTYHATTLRANV